MMLFRKLLYDVYLHNIYRFKVIPEDLRVARRVDDAGKRRSQEYQNGSVVIAIKKIIFKVGL